MTMVSAQVPETGAKVLDFYRQLPFNITGSPDAMAAEIKAFNSVTEYPPLTRILNPRIRVIDVGCGAGWLSNSIAHHFKSSVRGIDFNPVAVQFAREVSSSVGSDASFEQADLFAFNPDLPFDVAVSLGVLHHTADCMGALRHICTNFVRPGGFVFVGLYHLYGRRPFLEHFAEMRRSGADDSLLLTEFARLIGEQPIDQTHLESRFRDQVQHPHETQHTLAECAEVLEATGMKFLSSSIDGYSRADGPDAAIALEPTLQEQGRRWLGEGRYYPGFFCFLARKLGKA